jgi:hypothetical protein
MLFQSFLKIYFSFLFASLIFVSTGFSQSTSYLDSLDGKFALQFQITNNFSLSDFQGSVLSGKYHFSTRDAIRLGLEIFLGDSESETVVNHLDTNTVDQSVDDTNNFGFIINSQYIHYMRGTDDISLFGGIGPYYRYYKSTRNRELVVDEIKKISESENENYGVGLDLLVGVEWWFHKFMSLSAEYGLKFSYLSSKTSFEDDSIKGESEHKAYNISGNHINFGITVYF